MMKKNFLLPGIYSIAVSQAAFGAGFALNEQSAATLGTAFSTRALGTADASTLYGNPAGLTFLNKPMISLGAARVEVHTDISNASGTFPGSNRGDMIPKSNIPFGYVAYPLAENWIFGFGIYAPFGLSADYENNFQGRYFGTKSGARDITLQPTIAWKIDSHWSAAIGLAVSRFDGELSKNIPNPFSPGTNDITAKMTGHDNGLGYNMGLIYCFDDDYRIGIDYRSRVKYTLSGETKITNIPGSGEQIYDAKLDLTLPDSIELSASKNIVANWAFHAAVAKIGWHTFDEIHVVNSGGADVVETQDWRDTYFYAVGTSYGINENLLLRAGFAIDQSPTSNETRSVRLTDNDRKIFSIGARWKLSNTISADFAYAYTAQKTADIHQSDNRAGVYDATYKTYVDNFAAQINWEF